MNGQVNNHAYYFQIFLLLLPVLLGIVVALAKPLVIVNWTDRLGQWGIIKRANYSRRKGFLSYFLRPLFWGLSKIDQWTSNIKSEFTRSGVRVSAYMYFTGIFTYLAITVTFLIVAALVVLIAIGIATSLMSEGGGSSSGYSVRKKRVFGGDYTEHHDASGRKTGTSEVKERIFGSKYAQNYDEFGKKTGYSEEKEGILGGKYAQHYDSEGQKAGYSEKKEGLLGDKYTQHYDQDGTKTGYSENKEGILGDPYIQHYDQEGKKKEDSQDNT